MIEIRYFAGLRERLGPQEYVTNIPAGVHTLGQLLAWLRTRTPEHEQAFEAVPALRMARNHVMCEGHEPLADGDEIAFFPPVTGG